MRAYMGVIGGRAFFERGPSESASIMSGGSVISLKVALTVTNAGKTPAYRFRGGGSIKRGETFDPAWGDNAEQFSQNAYILPESEFEYVISEPIETIVGAEPDDPEIAKIVFVFGRLEYRDTFGRDRWTNFRFSVAGRLEIGEGALMPCEDGNDAN